MRTRGLKTVSLAALKYKNIELKIIKKEKKKKAVLIHTNGCLNFTKKSAEFWLLSLVSRVKFLEFALRLSE